MGGIRGPIGLWSEGPRVMGALLCAKCSSVCSRFEPIGSAVVCVSELIDLPIERERIPFYR